MMYTLLACCLVALAAGQDITASIGQVEVFMDPYPEIGSVIHLNPSFPVIFNSTYPTPQEVWLRVKISDELDGHAFYKRPFTVPNDTVQSQQFYFPQHLIHTYTYGSFEVVVHIQVLHHPIEGEDLILADDESTHYINATEGSERDVCDVTPGEEVPPGGVNGSCYMDGPCLANPYSHVYLTAHTKLRFWNQGDSVQKIPFKIHFDDQSGHEHYIHFCMFAPPNCYGLFKFWMAYHVEYYHTRRNEWFGWCSFCDFQRQGLLDKFNLLIDVVPEED